MPDTGVEAHTLQSGADGAVSVPFADDRIAVTPAPTRKRRLALVIAHLGPGGAQRVAVTAANALVGRGIEVHLLAIDSSQPVVYTIDPRITLHFVTPGRVPSNNGEFGVPAARQRERPVQRSSLATLLRSLDDRAGNLAGALVSAARLIKTAILLRRMIGKTQADTVLSFLTQTNILTLIATRGLKTRTVVSERNDPRLQRHLPRIETMRRIVYRWADLVTANSKGALAALEAYVAKDKLAFLPNPLALTATGEVTQLGVPTIITVGRCVEQKALHILLAAWASAVELLPQWRLAIVGDGPLRGELQALSRDLRIESTVDWHGHVADPFPLLRGAKFFVQTSLFEGTPNALLEAMACGLPAIVSDASPGPCELIGSDESAGLIVPVKDIAATAEAIARLARDETLRHRLGQVARERARVHELDQVIDVWLQILRYA